MSTDPQEQAWLGQQLSNIRAYLESQGIRPPASLQVGFSLPPKLSLWSETLPERSRQIWVVAGDCPTDYLVFDRELDARAAMSAFARHWSEVSATMKEGRQHATTRIGNPNDPHELRSLGDMLERRAQLLQMFAERDELWSE